MIVGAALLPSGLAAAVIDDGSAAARGTVRGVSALRFNVVYEAAGEGWVYAHVSELPEVQTQGEGLEQARAMVLEAIAMVLDERRALASSFQSPAGRWWSPSRSLREETRP